MRHDEYVQNCNEINQNRLYQMFVFYLSVWRHSLARDRQQMANMNHMRTE
jgi:hypothetical protein